MEGFDFPPIHNERFCSEIKSTDTMKTIKVLPTTRLNELARMNFNSDYTDLNDNRKTLVRYLFIDELLMSRRPVIIIRPF